MVLGAVGSIFLVTVFAIYLSGRTSPEEEALPSIQTGPGGIVEGTTIPPILQVDDDLSLRTQALATARRAVQEEAVQEEAVQEKAVQDEAGREKVGGEGRVRSKTKEKETAAEDSIRAQRVQALAERLRALREGRTEQESTSSSRSAETRRFYQEQLERHRPSDFSAGRNSGGSGRDDRHQKAVASPPPLLASSAGGPALETAETPENAHVALLRSAQKLAHSRGDGTMSEMLASLAAVYEENTPAESLNPPIMTPDGPGGVVSPADGGGNTQGRGAPPGVLRLQVPATPYEVKQGTSIPAILETAINSDVPGGVRARTTRNVYDSRTQRHLLIPKNSTIVGEAGSEQGSDRLAIVWTRVILPDGRSMMLGGQETKDGSGASGLPGEVDSHFFRRFRSAFLVSMVGAGVKIATYDDSRGAFDRPQIGQVVGSGAAEQTGEVATELLRRGLTVRPTVTVPPGQAFHVYVNQDLTFAAPYRSADGYVSGW